MRAVNPHALYTTVAGAMLWRNRVVRIPAESAAHVLVRSCHEHVLMQVVSMSVAFAPIGVVDTQYQVCCRVGNFDHA